jgi:hypothetical protein
VPETTFTETGKVTIQSGLDQDGDLAWRSEYNGMNPLEVVGALVVVGTRMVFKMVLPNLAKDDGQ